MGKTARFPNWKYISPNASAAISSIQTVRIDRAYFFTDTLAHSQYYKYIQVIRGRELPFGYIHALIALSKMGVRVFITTHDYFIQQCFNLDAEYSKKGVLKYRFISLYRDENGCVNAEIADTLSELSHNAIMEEFDALYDREQELMLDE